MKRYQGELLRELQMRRFRRRRDEDDEEAVDEEDEEVALKIDSMRLLSEQDLTRLKYCQTVEEFLDCYHHFHLYYGPDLIPMKEFEAKEKKLSDKKAKRLANKVTRKILNENGNFFVVNLN